MQVPVINAPTLYRHTYSRATVCSSLLLGVPNVVDRSTTPTCNARKTVYVYEGSEREMQRYVSSQKAGNEKKRKKASKPNFGIRDAAGYTWACFWWLFFASGNALPSSFADNLSEP